MSMQAITDYPVHELIANRWSPYGYAEKEVPDGDLCSVFEAARWAASSYNEQPWSYIVATKQQSESFEKLLSCLLEGNQAWAKTAPVLMLACTSLKFSRNGKSNTAAIHDLGLASSNFSLEATARGLLVHQMVGFLPEKARVLFAIPEGVQPVTALAIGYAADPATMPEEFKQRDQSRRQRKPITEFVFTGQWGENARNFF